MRRFRYLADPLFLFGCLGYAVNRWWIKPHFHLVFFHSWFNDLLLIPCALPPVLLAQRWLGLRSHDRFPTAGEVFGHVAGWSILFELIGPRILPTTGDPWDAVAYAVGGAAAFGWWQKSGRKKTADERTADFDGLAPFYAAMEWILAGQKLQRCRRAFLAEIPPPRYALVAGPGRGQFVADLLKLYPGVRCTCIDSSQRMLACTRELLLTQTLDVAAVEFVQADILQWRPGPVRYDLVVTQFFLDCFGPEQLQQVIVVLGQAAASESYWLVADFHQPRAGWRRWRAAAILQALYLFFRWAARLPAERLTSPDILLTEADFCLRGRKSFELGLLQSDLWHRK